MLMSQIDRPVEHFKTVKLYLVIRSSYFLFCLLSDALNTPE